MSINIWTDSMQHAALLGKPVLFTNWLIQRDIIPDGWYCYDLRGTHKSPSTRTTLVDHAADYHAGTVLSPIPLKHEGTASRRVNGTFYLLGEEMTLEQFCEEHDLAYPQDNREFVLRPASLDEVGLFYSEEKLDEALGTVGHLRMDFGHGEKEFWHTWWPHNEDRFNTPERGAAAICGRPASDWTPEESGGHGRLLLAAWRLHHRGPQELWLYCGNRKLPFLSTLYSLSRRVSGVPLLL